MTDTYAAEVLMDSLTPAGVRLTTVMATMPRMVLAELNTHRQFSRNSNSSRAIPPERQIERVRNHMFIPEMNKRVKGMGVGEALMGEEAEIAKDAWVDAGADAIFHAERLIHVDCDKSRVNRLLEPFLWHTVVITATEWDNFFALRMHPAAQPEFEIVARMIWDAQAESTPLYLREGEWHLPATPDFPMDDPRPDWDYWKRVSAGRLARLTSYNLFGEDKPDDARERARKLIGNFHMSPTEHQARPIDLHDFDLASPKVMLSVADVISNYDGFNWNKDVVSKAWTGNLRGWFQFRKEITNEHNAGLADALA